MSLAQHQKEPVHFPAGLNLQSWTPSTTAKAPFLSPPQAPLTASKCRMGYRLTGLKVAKVCDNWAHFEKLSVTSLEKKNYQYAVAHFGPSPAALEVAAARPNAPPLAPPGRPSAPPAARAAPPPLRRLGAPPSTLVEVEGQDLAPAHCAHKGKKG